MSASLGTGAHRSRRRAARRLARLRHLDLVGLFITVGDRRRRGPVGIPALLGAHHDVQTGERGRAPGGAALAGAFHLPELRSRPLADQDRDLVHQLAYHFGGGHGPCHRDGGWRRLCDLAADFSGPAALLVDNSGELHGADPGSDRQPFHPDQPARPHQHAARRRPAAAHRAGHGHHLQAVFRFRAEGFSRGRDDRWRE